MNAQAEKRPFACQPITARGVGAFAYASFGRLLLVQFICALITAGTVVWFLHAAWFPTVRQAIRQLPSQGVIRSGMLDWRADSPQRLAEGRFIALTVDLKHEGEARSPAHVQIEFGRTDFKIISLFGFLQRPYPKGWIIFFNRTELEPWWGAWSPPILAIVAGAVIAGLMLAWTCLATVYLLPVWLIGFFANRDLTFAASWRLAGAALMPGALFHVVAIIFYGLGALDLLRLVMAAALHVVVGWIYLFVGPLSLPRHPAIASLKPNPFVPDTSEPPKSGGPK
jgi:hypothetical protein